MSTITAVLFDFDHTLGVDQHLEFDVLTELARDACGQTPPREAVDAALARFRTGSAPLDATIVDAFRSWGCPESKLARMPDDFRARALNEAPQRVRPVQGAPELLRALKKRATPIGILTNGWTALQHLKADLIDFPGPTIVSEEIGVWKPDPKAFLIAASRLDMAPSTTVYVGDEPATDVAGSKAAGMLAALVALDDKTHASKDPQPDFVLTSVLQLLDVL